MDQTLHSLIITGNWCNLMKSDKIVIALTKNGSILGKKLANYLKADLRIPRRFIENDEYEYCYDRPVDLEIREAFKDYQRLILIMASEIAVRGIVPVINDKQTDPAVIVMDETGKYIISLLGGHWGEANRLAEELAKFTGGIAVITTAPVVNNLPGLDWLAKKYNLIVENKDLLPEFFGAIVNGEPVVIWDRWGIKEIWPDNVRVETGESFNLTEAEKLVVNVGYQEPVAIRSSVKILALRPSNLVVGVGCCEGVPGNRIIGAIRRYFRERNWSARSIHSLATIDLKSGEPGINMAAQEFGVPLRVFSKEELETINQGLQKTDIADSTGMMSEICEPAAILGANHGKLIGVKLDLNQITVAVAAIREKYRLE
jgi:cobalt-precorrin 5A hydrolase